MPSSKEDGAESVAGWEQISTPDHEDQLPKVVDEQATEDAKRTGTSPKRVARINWSV